MRVIKLNKPKTYKEAGNQLLEIINLNNIQRSNFNNFIRNIIPRYMNKVIKNDYFTVSFSNWYLDNSKIPSDKRCIAQKLTREVSLMAMVEISINNYRIGGKQVFDNITYTIPVELTRIPILSEQGSFIIKGVDRVMVSHLEDAAGINIGSTKKVPLKVNIYTSIKKTISIERSKDDKYTITLPKLPVNKFRRASQYESTKRTFKLFDFLKTMGIEDKYQLKAIVGNNNRMLFNYNSAYIDEDSSELLKNVQLSMTERERINRRLSFKIRLSGKELAEDVVIGDKTFKAGEVVNMDDAEFIQNSGISKVMVNTPLGVFPLVNNGFVSAEYLFKDGNVPKMFNHYDTESKQDDKVDGYLYISSDEYNILRDKADEDNINIESFLKLNHDNIIGGFVLKQDIVALTNLMSFIEMGFEDLDDRDSLSNKSIINISTIFESLIAEQIFSIGNTNANSKSLLNKISMNLDQYRLSSNNGSKFNLSNLDCEDNMTVTSRLLKDPLNKLFTKESNINPMDEISHKRKITLVNVSGRGGIDANLSMPVPRSVNPSHMGRICPIETTEGRNIGLILNLASLARVNEYDMIEAPFFKIDKERMKIDYSTIYYMTYDEEVKFNRAIAPQISDTRQCFVSLTRKGVEVDRQELNAIYQYEGQREVLVNKRELEEQARQIFKSHPEADAYKLNIWEKDWFKDDLVDCVTGNGHMERLKWGDIDYVTCRGEHIFSVVASSLPFPEYDDGTRLMMGISMSKQTEPTLGSEEPLIKTPISTLVGKESMSIVKSPVDAVVTSVNSKIITLVPIEDGENDGKEISIPLEQCKVSYEFTKISNTPCVNEGDIVLKGDIIAGSEAAHSGELTTGNNLLVAYIPYEGYNFEDAIVISSRLLEENVLTSYRLNEYVFEFNTEFDYRINDSDINEHQKFLKRCTNEGIIKVGSRVNTKDVLALKYTMYKGDDKLKTNILQYTGIDEGVVTRVVTNELNKGVITYTIQITTKEKIKIGDKLAGRHGNKGVIGRIIPKWQMPFLKDGTPLDIILTPLGIPSRMNIGQLLESQLGLILKDAGIQIVTYPSVNLDIPRLKALLNNYVGDEEGKIQLYDGRTGKPLMQKSNVGVTTINKLKHLAAHKVAARSYGSFNQYNSDGQPTKGRKRMGGQTMGEMEMWVLEGHGASKCAQELFTYKSDDVANREIFIKKIKNNSVEELDFNQNFTNSYRRVMCYLQSAGIDIEHFDPDGELINIYEDKSTLYKKNNNKVIERNNYALEKRKSDELRLKEQRESVVNLDFEDKFTEEDTLNDILGGLGIEVNLGGSNEVNIETSEENYDDLDNGSVLDILNNLKGAEIEDTSEKEEKYQDYFDRKESESFSLDMDDDDLNDTLREEEMIEEENNQIEDMDEFELEGEMSDKESEEEPYKENKEVNSANNNDITEIIEDDSIYNEDSVEIEDDLDDDSDSELEEIEEDFDDDDSEEELNIPLDLSGLSSFGNLSGTFEQQDYSKYGSDNDYKDEIADKYADYYDDDYQSFEKIKRKRNLE